MKNRMNLAIGALFFFSGLTSLVYQAVWIRTLSLGVGSTSASMSLVLSIFFFGLSAGSYFTGQFAHKIKKPILFYGIIEAFIGVYAIGLVYVLTHFHSVLAVLPLTGSLSWFGTLCKFALVFILLIAPTLCMGASLPLLIQFFVKEDKSVGRLVSLLYGVNTLGAVAGAFLSGFYFIPKFGIYIANHSMAALNVLILLVAVYLQKHYQPLERGDSHKSGALNTELKKDLNKKSLSLSALTTLQKFLLVSCGVTGFSSIAAEVMWNKYLGIFLGSNIFGLSLILTLFLLGIAIGSLVLSTFIDKVKDLVKLYVAVLLLACIMMIGASYLLNLAPILTNVISYYIGGSVSLIIIKSALTGVILFLPTCFFGALLPLGIRLLTDKADMAAAITGVTYSINTVGSILGSYFAGIILIPMIGSGRTLQIAILLLLVTGTAVTVLGLKKTITRTVFLLLYAALFVGSFNYEGINFKNIVKSAYYQTTPKDLSMKEAMRFFAKDAERFKLIVEGQTAVISLSQDPAEATNWEDYLRLKTNGLNESLYDVKNLDHLPKYEALLGLLPYALARDPQKAFVVGYGGGYTVDFLSSTDLKEVYVAELEHGIIEAAQFVYKNENPILKRANVNLNIEDARFALAAKLGGPYDIIVSQPSHSWLSGVANLFTSEYFEIVKSNLSDRGIFSQWLNLYNMDTAVLKSVLHTFYKTFPYGAIFSDRGDEEMIMIGSMHPIEFNHNKLQAIFQNKRFNEQLTDFKTAYDFLSTFSMGREEVVALTKDAELNTDINAYAEVRQSQLFYTFVNDHPGDFLINNYRANFKSIVSDEVARDPAFHLNMLQSLRKFPGESQGYQKFYTALQNYTKNHENEVDQYYKLAEFNYQIELYAKAKKYLDQFMAKKPTPEALDLLIRVNLATKDYASALSAYNKYAQYQSASTDCYAVGVFTYTSNWSKAKTILNRVLSKYSDYKALCGSYLNQSLGAYYFYNGSPQEAIQYLQSSYDEYPYDLRNLELLISAYFANGQSYSGNYYSSIYQGAYDKEKNRLDSLAYFFETEGHKEDAEFIRKQIENMKR
ncbi:MAG: fused MFS/spermidine synthase [Bdellovibrionales bacterium]|nr:fused MFS/spermidine synthase [Bdellovibrionales bacterium]